MYANVIILLTCLIMCSSVATGQNMANDVDKGAIGFPESEENPKFVNKQNRQPVFLPSKCPVNQLYYPGDQQYDWICDCRPGHLYDPGTDACWLAYQRGPCPEGQYLVLPKSSMIPICEINPCKIDNFVMWRGKCETLGALIPCGIKYPASALWVNASTITLDCVRIYTESKLSSSDNISRYMQCLPGCKRSVNNQCMPDPRK